jgi:uncharacterized membrane protein YbhN (UPF0104 family)
LRSLSFNRSQGFAAYPGVSVTGFCTETFEMKRLIFLLLGIGVSLGCLAWSMRETNLAELKQAFANANYLTLPAMLALLFAFYWLKAIRWKWLLAPVRQFTTRELFAPVMTGFAANNILPAHLGEFVRVFFVRHR